MRSPVLWLMFPLMLQPMIGGPNSNVAKPAMPATTDPPASVESQDRADERRCRVCEAWCVLRFGLKETTRPIHLPRAGSIWVFLARHETQTVYDLLTRYGAPAGAGRLRNLDRGGRT